MAGNGRGYRLRATARQDLLEIWRHTQARWGERQADDYLDQLTRAFLLLARNPELGVACDGIRGQYRKKPAGRHVVYYRIEDGGIIVARVLHERMRARWRIREAERN